jgi:hypothetical protein
MASVTWKSSVGGDWDTASNWSSSPSLPGAGDAVSISLATSAGNTITHSTSATDSIASLTVGGSNAFNISAGSLTVGGAASLVAQVGLSGGSFVLNGTSSFSSLSETGGTLGGTGTLTVTGSAVFRNSNVETGAGTTDLKAATTIGVGGQGNGVFALALDGGRTLKNETTITWVGGVIQMGSNLFGGTLGNSTISNVAGATFDDRFDAQIRNGTGTNTFANAGTFKKSGGVATTTVATIFNNTGKLEADSGIISLTGGGSSSGSIVVGAGAEVQFNSPAFALTGGTVSGAGALELASGTLTLNVAFADPTSYIESGGVLSGTGTLTLTGSALFKNSNTETGSGTTDLKGATTIGVGGQGVSVFALSLDGGRTLKNETTVTWVGGVIQTGANLSGGTLGNSTISNVAGATFDDQFDAQIRNGTGTNTFANAGTFKKSGGLATTTVATTFNNTGTVDAESGTLDFTGPVTQYAGGSTTLTGGKWIAGAAGTLQFGQAGLSNILTNAADVTLSGAGSTFALIDHLTSNTGAFRLLAGRSFTTVGAFANSGTLQLGGGTFGGGTLTNGATGTIVGFGTLTNTTTDNGAVEATGGTLKLTGAVSGSGALKLDAGATLELGAAVGASNTVVFNGAAARLKLDQPAGLHAPISGFGFGDLIDLTGVNAVSASLTGSTLTITKSDSTTLSLTLSGSYAGRVFGVQSDGAGGSFVTVDGVLTTGADTLIGSQVNDLATAAASTLSAGDAIDFAGGTNTLRLVGGGTFDLRAPTSLLHLQTVLAQEGASTALQTVDLRNGLNVTLNVASGGAGAGIKIVGGNDSSIINLGTGADTVTLGSANETVNGTTGKYTFNVTATTIGATIKGGTGANTLAVSGNGTAVMGSNITGVKSVKLSGTSVVFTSNALNLAITVGNAGETVHAGGGTDSVLVTAATIGATIDGGTGKTTLVVNGGGTAVMGSNITKIAAVTLKSASNFTANNLALLITGSTGADTIHAGGGVETITGAGGADILVAGSASDTFKDKTANLTQDTIQNFVAGDVIDLTDFKPSATPTTASWSAGMLTVTQGAKSASIALPGSFTGTFSAASDGLAGTKITYTPPAAQVAAMADAMASFGAGESAPLASPVPAAQATRLTPMLAAHAA